MSSITVVTNRHLCEEDFLVQIERLLAAGIDRLILREKDLSEEEYLRLAEAVMRLCAIYDTECTLHTFAQVAEEVGCSSVHLPMRVLRETKRGRAWRTVGTSIHSLCEAQEAIHLGADYLIAGHIFETECKRGVKGRGVGFLQEVSEAVEVPVYAIGGITADNVGLLGGTGMAGICVMSSAMRTDNVSYLVRRLRQNML